MYSATEQLVKILLEQLKNRRPGLDYSILHDLVRSGVQCPGFNDLQKATLVFFAELPWTAFGVHPYAMFWPFTALTIKLDVPKDIVQVSWVSFAMML